MTSSSAQTDRPNLQIHEESSGLLRLSATGDTNRAIVEETDLLSPFFHWSPADIGVNGIVPNWGKMRIFRLRLEPLRRPPATAASLGTLSFKEAPEVLKPSEQVRFALSGEGDQPVDARWFVNGTEGGSAENGFIDRLGVFTAPARPGVAEIRGEVTVGNGEHASAQKFVQIARSPVESPSLISAVRGGEVQSEDGQSELVIPAGALKQDLPLSITPASTEELDAFNANDSATVDVVGVVVLGPDGSVFNSPLTVRMRLDRWVEPGTKLSIELLAAGGVWGAAGIEGEVDTDGVTLVFQTPHFSTLRAVLPRGPIVSRAPNVREISPPQLLEGELRPILLRGTNFTATMRVTVHENALLGPAPFLKVVSKAFNPSAPGEFGVLLKSFPDPRLSSGATRSYILRLAPVSGPATTVNITIGGLDELIVPAGTTLDLSAGATPPASSLVFSKIEVQEAATLLSHSTLLAWQATDSIYIYGQVMARGRDGAPGVLGSGGVPTPGVETGGRGGSLTTAPTDGNPVLTPDLTQFLPGSLDARYGQAGTNGHDPGSGHYMDPLNAISEGMYALFDSEVNSRRRDPFDFNFWNRVATELTALHPEGRKGQQGHPGGFIPRPPRSGFYVGSRRIERGGGGGGGGASFRPNSIDRASGNVRIGLGGGSGGAGGGAISFAAGNQLIVGPNAVIDTRGGNGGDGATPIATDFSNALLLGRGAGGGPGGAGSIHLLAGQRLTGGNGPPFRNTAGAWGAGGFLMVVGTHSQATPRSWIQPAEDPGARSQGEVAGPDFANNSHSIQTRIQTDRLIEAVAQNPYTQAAEVIVMNSNGSQTLRLVGHTAQDRRVRIALEPGTNHIVIASSPYHAVLNRDILVLGAPDSDNDGVPDTEEIRIGTDAHLADTDHDGTSDIEDWLGGGAGIPGDSDGDGFPDPIEVAFQSDPNDTDATPLNSNLGLGGNRGLIIGNPPTIVSRPSFTLDPRQLFITGTPPGVRVIRPAIGREAGVPYNIIFARPESILVRRP